MRPFVILGLTLAATATGLVAFIHDSTEAVPSPTRGIAFHRFAIGTDAVPSAHPYRFVVLQAWQLDELRALRRERPDAKVLVYKNLSLANCDSSHRADRYQPQGVRCDDVETDHPEWFLTDGAGERLSSSSYPWLRLLDVGNSAYQHAWAEAVAGEALSNGWDGVMIDDADSTLRAHVEPARVARYPDDAAWSEATTSALEAIAPRLRAAGLLAVANICCSDLDEGLWERWLSLLSGANQEHFAPAGDERVWRLHLEEALASERLGRTSSVRRQPAQGTKTRPGSGSRRCSWHRVRSPPSRSGTTSTRERRGSTCTRMRTGSDAGRPVQARGRRLPAGFRARSRVRQPGRGSGRSGGAANRAGRGRDRRQVTRAGAACTSRYSPLSARRASRSTASQTSTKRE
ncbi:MAG: putative glycoside hydrolase [Gaiellaceae bacterium]